MNIKLFCEDCAIRENGFDDGYKDGYENGEEVT